MKNIKSSKTFIVHPVIDKKSDTEYKLNEIKNLASAIDLDIYEAVIVNINRINSASFINSGKIKEYSELIKEHNIDLLIFNYDLTPLQQRNLEKSLNCKVIDRTLLIIDIFADRAKTNEGKLQVELVALQYQKSRLVRSWTHLERQRGGFGFIGGPGETQIESDRRNIRNQIKKIKEELEKVKKTRSLHRKSRKKIPYPIVSLVGYTNAGKTSLFNLLTKENQYADDKLFATLDTVMRKIKTKSGKEIILSDTVGFISDLPTELVMAFSATLEEVTQADIILHIVDISNDNYELQKKEVNKTLELLKIDTNRDDIIIVNNKIDSVSSELPDDEVNISVKEKLNIDNLLNKIDEIISKDEIIIKAIIDNNDGMLLNWLYNNSQIIGKIQQEESTIFEVKISEKNNSIFNLIKIK